MGKTSDSHSTFGFCYNSLDSVGSVHIKLDHYRQFFKFVIYTNSESLYLFTNSTILQGKIKLVG